MSRAFVKDDDDRPEEPLPAPERGPYYVFAADVLGLDAEFAQRASVVTVKAGVVGFGARVTVRDEGGASNAYVLVNDEDADPLRARIGMTSPLAQALLGKRVGGNAVWERPVGNAQLTIEKIEQIDG
ncbi:MAG TPA: GreA/GreB family elongation factor [Candidatus Baltobacteraceae bacterium]